MTTTISGTTVTFTDGSTWGGANGGLTPDGNTSRTSQSFNIGHIILANCIFSANATGFQYGGTNFWSLNVVNSWFNIYGFISTNPPGANITYAADDSRLGSQSYYALGNNGQNGVLAGSWRARGQACGAGINQTNGYFVLMERVA